MMISPDLLKAMKAAAAPTLKLLGAAKARATEAEAQAARAADAQTRLHARLAEIDREMEQPFITPDDKRVARLLAGDTPATLEAEEVQARAQRNGLLTAEKAQLVADADAVGTVRETARAEVATCKAEVTRLEERLVRDVVGAAADTYADLMRDFVAEHVRALPWLMAVHHRVLKQNHQRLGYNLDGLMVAVWPREAGNYKQLWPSHEVPEMVRKAGVIGSDLDHLVAVLEG